MLTPGIVALSLLIGQLAQGISLPDETGQMHALPDAQLPTLVVYEDRDGQRQSVAAKALIARYNDRPQNRALLKVWPVADLSRWDWWPAKGKALAEVQRSATKNNTRVLIDWTGAAHRAWGLKKATNSLVLLDRDGRVRWISEGECTPAQQASLEQTLRALGLSL